VALSALTLGAFVDRLASADPTPGGGSASATVGSIAAALVQMVARLTSGSPKFSAVAERADGIGAAAQRLRAAFLQCIDDDAAAFDRVGAAYKMAKTSDAEKVMRTAAIQDALLAAAGPPLRAIELAHETALLAAALVDIGNPNVASDIGCAALCAQAAAQGAAFNVRINIKGLKDEHAAQDCRDRMHRALAQVDLLSQVVWAKVQTGLGV